MAAPAGLGPVVLDIGGDVGALVIGAPPRFDGAELEICPAGRRSGDPDEGAGWWAGEWRGEHGHGGHRQGHSHPAGPAWPHVAVLRRPGGTGHAAVFPALREGRYEVWLRPDDGAGPAPTLLVATVRGGQVTALAWPGD